MVCQDDPEQQNGIGCWFGLHRQNNDSKWTYIDGTNIKGSYGFDMNGSPNDDISVLLDNKIPNQNCAHLANEYNFRWNNINCSALHVPLCKRNPPKSCGINHNDLKVWYQSSLIDISNNGHNAINIQGSTIQRDTNDCSLYGYTTDSFEIPYNVTTTQYTILYMAKYNTLETNKRKHILTASNANYHVGFGINGQVGISYQGEWITSNDTNSSNDWLISTAYPNKYRKNGEDISNGNSAWAIDTDPGSLNLGINIGREGTQSDWSLHEIMIFESILTEDQMTCLENYLSQQHGLSPSKVPAKTCLPLSKSPTPNPTSFPTISPTSVCTCHYECYNTTKIPTSSPTQNPTKSSMTPTTPTIIPTKEPTMPGETNAPTVNTDMDSKTFCPTPEPTPLSLQPTISPTIQSTTLKFDPISPKSNCTSNLTCSECFDMINVIEERNNIYIFQFQSNSPTNCECPTLSGYYYKNDKGYIKNDAIVGNILLQSHNGNSDITYHDVIAVNIMKRYPLLNDGPFTINLDVITYMNENIDMDNCCKSYIVETDELEFSNAVAQSSNVIYFRFFIDNIGEYINNNIIQQSIITQTTAYLNRYLYDTSHIVSLNASMTLAGNIASEFTSLQDPNTVIIVSEDTGLFEIFLLFNDGSDAEAAYDKLFTDCFATNAIINIIVTATGLDVTDITPNCETIKESVLLTNANTTISNTILSIPSLNPTIQPTNSPTELCEYVCECLPTPEPTRLPTEAPIVYLNGKTFCPTPEPTSPTLQPTPSPTTEFTELERTSSNCNVIGFNPPCWNCLDNIDIIETEPRKYTLQFQANNPESNCTCPQGTGYYISNDFLNEKYGITGEIAVTTPDDCVFRIYGKIDENTGDTLIHVKIIQYMGQLVGSIDEVCIQTYGVKTGEFIGANKQDELYIRYFIVNLTDPVINSEAIRYEIFTQSEQYYRSLPMFNDTIGFRADLSSSMKYGNEVFDLTTSILLQDIIPHNDTAILEFWLTFPYELQNKTRFTGIIEASCNDQTDPIAIIVTNVTGLSVSNSDCQNIPGHTSLTCIICDNPSSNGAAAAAGIEEEEPEYIPTYIGMIMMIGLFTTGGTFATIGITKLLGA